MTKSLWQELRAEWTDEQLVELGVLVGRHDFKAALGRLVTLDHFDGDRRSC